MSTDVAPVTFKTSYGGAIAMPMSEYLILEVLAARTRLGEACWTFPTKCRAAARRLESWGLVSYKDGVIENTLLVWLTDDGKTTCLDANYASPLGSQS
jgi:hypothetical protein